MKRPSPPPALNESFEKAINQAMQFGHTTPATGAQIKAEWYSREIEINTLLERLALRNVELAAAKQGNLFG